jgi:LemA protein
VRDYNRRVQSFPSNVIANMFSFKEEEFFEVDEALRGEAGVPRVSFEPGAPGVSFGTPGTPGAPAAPAQAPEPPPPPPSGGTSPS